MSRDQQGERIPDVPVYGDGETWTFNLPADKLPPIDAAVKAGMDLITGELMPLIEARAGEDVAQEIREMVTPHVRDFHNDEPARILVAIEELAKEDLLEADRASELFYLMAEGLTTNPDWKKKYGKDSKRMADSRVRGLIARSKLQVSNRPEVGGHRLYNVTDLNRYEKELEKAA
ncbi:hypothetical protein JXA59_02945 [Patescibacteria group bacterium]|nr:hypothetical protein [Patescibacteria group bacterium]